MPWWWSLKGKRSRIWPRFGIKFIQICMTRSPVSLGSTVSEFTVYVLQHFIWIVLLKRVPLLKRNKYVGILSIAVTTLQYITISMITIFSMYIAHVRLGSGHNSYQGHVNDSGEFWRVLGCTRIRCHWKRNIVDTFTHHFCANGHGWTIGTGFPYIRTSKRQYSTPVQYTCISSCLSWLYFALQALSLLKPYTR